MIPDPVVASINRRDTGGGDPREVQAEPLWEASFDRSTNTLEQLAAEALEEHHAGRTEH